MYEPCEASQDSEQVQLLRTRVTADLWHRIDANHDGLLEEALHLASWRKRLEGGGVRGARWESGAVKGASVQSRLMPSDASAGPPSGAKSLVSSFRGTRGQAGGVRMGQSIPTGTTLVTVTPPLRMDERQGGGSRSGDGTVIRQVP